MRTRDVRPQLISQSLPISGAADPLVRVFFCSLALLLLALPSSAQTVAYRTSVLASDRPVGAHTSPTLLNPWGIAFLPGGNFFIAENASGRVDSYDADGNPVAGVAIPAPPGSTAPFSRPIGIAAVPEADFGPNGSGFQFLVAADNGTIWGFSTGNGVPQVAARFVDNSSSAARYTGIAVVRPACCGAYVAVANFGQGFIDTFTRLGDPLSLSPHTANPFVDPNLPAGYAPFNIQEIGDLVVVTYAVRDAAGNPVGTDGSGIVNLFDQEGNFVKRFVSQGGALSAPWGVARASASFGPFSNDILIANAGGDRSINAFDPATGNFLGQLTDGTGSPLFFAGMRGLAFRADGIGDPNTLYEVDGAAEGATPTGVFGTITTGNTSFIGLQFSVDTMRGTVLPADPVTVTAGIVAASGTPTGTVVFVDTCCTSNPTLTQTPLGTANVANGTASVVAQFPSGDHVITASYSGDTNFAAGSQSGRLVVPFATTTTLTTPSSAVSGTPVLLNANVGSSPGVQLSLIAGQVTFLDGNVSLGTAAVNAGIAQLTVNSLAPGVHTIVALYTGSRFFLNSQSAPSSVTIGIPVPAITSLAPFSEKQNSGAFTLTVNGFGFVNGAVVTFNGAPKPTEFVSATQLKAAIAASDLSAVGTATVTVTNATSGGGTSETALFAIDTTTATSVTLSSPSLTIAAGQSVTVGAQLSGFSGALTLMCLNAPAGVNCTFDSANNVVKIQTDATTPKGAHAITLVFGGQALASNLSSATLLATSFAILGLPIGSVITERRRRRKFKAAHWILPFAALLLMMIGCGGNGGSPKVQPNPSPQSQSAQASASLTLTVQ